MRVRVLACLPRIITEQDVVELGSSRIVHLPFQEWIALEGQSQSAAYNKLEWKYTKRPPAFWETSIEVESALVLNRKPENVQALRESVAPELEATVRAIHWYTGTAPVHPDRSVTYFDPRSEENLGAYPDLGSTIADAGVQRSYGESEKEYATENQNPNIGLMPSDEKPLAAMLAFARHTQSTWMDERYELASQSLGLCSSPGLGWDSQIVLLVGAYEALLLPDRPKQLQRGFERRFACMAADRLEDAVRYAGWIKPAYRLRSDLIHGRPLAETLKEVRAHPANYVGWLSLAGVMALCRLIRYRHAHPEVQEESDPLWAALDKAAEGAEEFAAMQAWMKPDTEPPQHQWLQSAEG